MHSSSNKMFSSHKSHCVWFYLLVHLNEQNHTHNVIVLQCFIQVIISECCRKQTETRQRFLCYKYRCWQWKGFHATKMTENISTLTLTRTNIMATKKQKKSSRVLQQWLDFIKNHKNEKQTKICGKQMFWWKYKLVKLMSVSYSPILFCQFWPEIETMQGFCLRISHGEVIRGWGGGG